MPNIPGLDQVEVLTSDNLWTVQVQPKRLLVLGGGPIGVELAQAFARLGSTVTTVEALPRLLNREDPEVSALISTALAADGVTVLTGFTAERVETADDGFELIARNNLEEVKRVPFDAILVTVGRSANVSGFGLEALGVEIARNGMIAVDNYLRTNIPNIFAIGDVAGPYQFTHTASHMAWYAAVNALFGTYWKMAVDYSVIPWCTYTSPEVARVGINETDAAAAGTPVEVTHYDIAGLDRALADESANGFVKVITREGTDKILGVTIVSDHAGDVISEYVLAMKHGLGLGKIMGTIHIYPTLSEMNKFAASQWRKAHKPERLLVFAEKLHSCRRGQGFRRVG